MHRKLKKTGPLGLILFTSYKFYIGLEASRPPHKILSENNFILNVYTVFGAYFTHLVYF